MKFCKSEFEDFTSHVSIELEKKDKDYKKVVQRNKDILNKYPKIRDLFENNEPQEFNRNFYHLRDRIYLIQGLVFS